MKHLKQQLESNGGHQAENVRALTALVKDRVLHAPGLVSMTASERAHQVRPRAGADRHVHAMASLAERETRFCPNGVDPAAMRRNLDSSEDLVELRSVLEAALQKVDDTILFRTGQAYGDALDVYALVQSLARREPELHASVAGFESFLSTGPREPATPVGENK